MNEQHASGLTRRAAMAALAPLAVSPLGAAAQADFPNKPVRLMVGYPPGGPNDTIARAIALVLSETWKQNVFVENKPGASGIIGSEVVAHAPPDGYTLLLTTLSHTILGSLQKLPFDPIADFSPISMLGHAPLVLVVHPSVPASNMKELIAYAKSKPGTLSFGSTGTGTSTHIFGEMLKKQAEIFAVHIPYRGTVGVMTDLLGGRIHMMFDSVASSLPHIKAGRLRPLAVLSAKRAVDLPEVPTAIEAGFPGFDVSGWWGILAPARLPRPVQQKISTAVVAALGTPDVRKRFSALGAEIVGSSPDEFDQQMRRDQQRYAAIIKDANIRLD